MYGMSVTHLPHILLTYKLCRQTPDGRVDHGNPARGTRDGFCQSAMAILANEVAPLALIDVAYRQAYAHGTLEELLHLFDQVSINHFLYHFITSGRHLLSFWGPIKTEYSGADKDYFIDVYDRLSNCKGQLKKFCINSLNFFEG